MLNRTESMLKLVCAALGILLLAQIVHRAIHPDALGRATIPPLPKLTVIKETPTTNAMPTTNAVARATNGPMRGISPRRGRSMGGRPGGGGEAAKLPTNIQARIDHIKESEILGPFMRPMPMALMGIADDEVFLRAPDGQTGLVKVGKDLGGVKILKIGINRVLVEEDGTKKELTLFEGAGGESLMPAETDNSTNAVKKHIHKEHP